MTAIYSILAIDPGACTGWALFDGGVLKGAGITTPQGVIPVAGADLVVIENPQIYPNGKARPEDILKLARVVGRYEERYRTSKQYLVTPREWKGSVDGDIMTRRIEGSLTPQQKAVTDLTVGGKRHNMLDAVGMGLWALKQPFVRKSK